MKIMHGITLCFLAMTAVVQAAHPQVPVPGLGPTTTGNSTATATKTHTGRPIATRSVPMEQSACLQNRCNRYCTYPGNDYDRGFCQGNQCWCADRATDY
jgi:hypothetical protein